MSCNLILIGGAPGSGKTHIGKELARALGIFIDKDTISRFFAEALLEALSANKNDRESDTYRSSVRSLEYTTMLKQAYENLALDHNVVCSAPFIVEFTNDQWMADVSLECESYDANLHKIWIYADERIARQRLINRGADRDNYKLANWEEYVHQMPHEPPPNVEGMIVIDNTEGAKRSLSEQIAETIAMIRGGSA